jgi:hypothetical protein
VLTAIVAPYLHLGPVHLGSNVVGFLLVAGVVYAMEVLSGNRRRFRACFVTS